MFFQHGPDDPLFNEMDRALDAAFAAGAENVKRYHAAQVRRTEAYDNHRSATLQELHELAVRKALILVRLKHPSYNKVGTESPELRAATKQEAVALLLDAHLLLAQSQLAAR